MFSIENDFNIESLSCSNSTNILVTNDREEKCQEGKLYHQVEILLNIFCMKTVCSKDGQPCRKIPSNIYSKNYTCQNNFSDPYKFGTMKNGDFKKLEEHTPCCVSMTNRVKLFGSDCPRK